MNLHTGLEFVQARSIHMANDVHPKIQNTTLGYYITRPQVDKLYEQLTVLEPFAHCLDVVAASCGLIDVAEIKKRIDLKSLLCPIQVLLHPHYSLLAAASRSFTQAVTSSTKGDEVMCTS